jgi:hypothetical protein
VKHHTSYRTSHANGPGPVIMKLECKQLEGSTYITAVIALTLEHHSLSQTNPSCHRIHPAQDPPSYY